jgi:hypothetical protein
VLALIGGVALALLVLGLLNGHVVTDHFRLPWAPAVSLIDEGVVAGACR